MYNPRRGIALVVLGGAAMVAPPVTERGYIERDMRDVAAATPIDEVTKVGPLKVSVTYAVTGVTKALTPTS